jgi:hypothetical protein
VISGIFLGETVDWQQALGIACVIAGVWFISRTNHITRRDGENIRRQVEPRPPHSRKLIQQERA